jgi:hypothetical protein
MACFQQGMYGDSANNEARLPRLPQLRDSTNPLSNRFTTYPKDEIAIIFQQLTDLIHHWAPEWLVFAHTSSYGQAHQTL